MGAKRKVDTWAPQNETGRAWASFDQEITGEINKMTNHDHLVHLTVKLMLKQG